MHPNPAFRTSENPRDIDFVRARAFGTLSINGEDAPLTSHIPFLLDESGETAELHLVRSNPIVAAAKAPVKAVITCLGPDGYVSPDWYGVDDQVPTWNYVAVRITGTLEMLPQSDMHPLLDRLSDHFESQLQKRPWTSDKMSEGVMDRMMRMIVPFRMHSLQIEGTWKLNQNKEAAARLNAAKHIDNTVGVSLTQLQTLMTEAE